MPAFTFPPALPPEMEPRRAYHGIEYTHRYFKAMLDELTEFLRAETQ
jgi:hypothetical protein